MSKSADYLFTSESVSEGHPDKIADQISDAVVDEFIRLEPEARVAVETLTTTNQIVLAGEVRGPAEVDAARMEQLARAVVKKIGYEQDGFHHQHLNFTSFVHEQSADIAQGVDAGSDKEEGAGDQGIMFGYACRETENLMPAPIDYSHQILQTLAQTRHANPDCGLLPDAKSQLTLEYKDGKPVKARSVVVSTQHQAAMSQADIRKIVRQHTEAILPEGWMCDDDELYVNPTGQFIIGGPDGDAGLTGRKIIVDTYGGAAPHGGGAFSGKDPTKVDRSAAYMARYLAKNVVASGLADKCVIQLSYAIGVSHPISVYVDFADTGKVANARLSDALRQMVDLSPAGIRKALNLNRPIYLKTAAYGHFGRKPEADGSFSWEKCDLVKELQSLLP